MNDKIVLNNILNIIDSDVFILIFLEETGYVVYEGNVEGSKTNEEVIELLNEEVVSLELCSVVDRLDIKMKEINY